MLAYSDRRMIPMSIHMSEVRRLFGEDAAHEEGSTAST
jgi:hypothetical protein